jgi:Fe-S oxidoreductase
VLFHGHCQQKAVASTAHALKIMSFPANYSAEEIKSGCCGMAGSFGYDRKNHGLSMKIGELSLFPAIRRKKPDEKLAASGTSCRHQIRDGTGQEAAHPVEVLWEAWLNK